MKKIKLNVNTFSNKRVQEISEKFDVSKITSNILLNRGLETDDSIYKFLNPSFDYFENPLNFKDLDKGCLRVKKAIENKEKILIYGDYDVDGTTSISQFVIYLRKLNVDVIYYVPDRETEGYGISNKFLDEIKTTGINLLITVDCGIAEVEAIDVINNLGIDVILIDHHQCGDIIPNAYAVVNPKQKNCNSTNKTLCASGLTYKFISHLNSYIKVVGIEEDMLQLACLGTVADIVELLNDNRIITYFGLKKISEDCLCGIKKLIEVSGIKDNVINSFHIGFILAPRINAAGRMSTANKAVELLISEDEEHAEKLAKELDTLNSYRKETEQSIFEEAKEIIEKQFLYKKNIIVVYGEGWHEGVLGIVSSRITEKYNKPSIVISLKNGIGKGSARSLNYLNIYEVLNDSNTYLEKYGGHKLAAGLTVKESNLNEFIVQINKYVDINVNKEDISKIIKVDSQILINDINNKLNKELCMLEPFGHGNKKPTFLIEEFNVGNVKRIGKDKSHISFNIYNKNECAFNKRKSINVVGFNKLSMLQKILLVPPSLVVNLNENEFRGNKDLQLILIDIEDFNNINKIFKVDSKKIKVVNSLINRTKSKTIKTEIFGFAEKINRMYNINITVEDILNIVHNDKNISYVLKDNILYIRK